LELSWTWTQGIVQWRPRLRKKSAGRPQKCWLDDIREKAGGNWNQTAQNMNEVRRGLCPVVDHEKLLAWQEEEE